MEANTTEEKAKNAVDTSISSLVDSKIPELTLAEIRVKYGLGRSRTEEIRVLIRQQRDRLRAELERSFREQGVHNHVVRAISISNTGNAGDAEQAEAAKRIRDSATKAAAIIPPEAYTVAARWGSVVIGKPTPLGIQF